MSFHPGWLGMPQGENPRCLDKGDRNYGNCDDRNPPTLAPVHS
jgi:hypothetical protein